MPGRIEMLSRKSIDGRFGSRRGLIRHIRYGLLHKLGRYQPYIDIDWRSIDRLVFVCKGNICRSAFAEVVAKKEGFSAVSCGIDTIAGAPANERAVSIAEELGFNLAGHTTTPIQRLAFSEADLLIAMEPLQAVFLEKYLHMKRACTLLGLWTAPVRPYIHDPYGADRAYFKSCFHFIESAVHEIIKKNRSR